jgi:hypothetical protein
MIHGGRCGYAFPEAGALGGAVWNSRAENENVVAARTATVPFYNGCADGENARTTFE